LRLPQARLDQVLDRFREIEARMGAATEGPEIVRLGKEHAELKSVAEAVLALEKVLAEKPDLEAMAADADPEISELARDELERLEARLPEMERDVALLLAPRDRDENASAILEVRAGTGGDEAALFAGDLFRMYQRYAAGRGWRVEIDSVSEGEMGGYKEIIASITGDGVVRPAEVRERRAPGAARAGHRNPGPHPHQRRHRRRPARGRGRGHRHQRRRPADRHLPLVRRRRPARQQDRLRRAHHPPAHRHRGSPTAHREAETAKAHRG